ncbi:N-acetylneuraminate synthase family protein [Pseudodesulfovibrio sediminis]|uniref:Spore coat protein n=1 Tax=Pseudodesulfovibrio sediminis TaxID=2810563 RepID=A0ABN6EUQ5_9BACT|nr:N-acetylneuraminate synthase family protein [Pseudodesulfovibrio sediminis]BCS89192.1 spore coat protein [Pseudodesulfovibrio sediminis]
MNTVKIGEKLIGEGHPPFFIAELGTCHEGNLDVALDLTRKAVEAGADCIKSELFYETEVRDNSAIKTFSIRGKRYEVPLLDHMRRYQFTLDQHHEIKKLADQLGVPFMATAHDEERVDFLVRIGAESIKIASPDIVHYPLIRYAARSGLALVLDTGGAWQHEVEMAVKIARDAGCERLIVNHQPDGHPGEPWQHNLRVMSRYMELFQTPVGLSDHFDGYEMVHAAVAAGAQVIEKPISRDRFMEACEHIWSVTIEDLPEVLRTMHMVYEAMGQPQKPMKPGLRPQSPHRVALVAKRNLVQGDIINLTNITFGKPRLGIGVEHWDELEGHTLSNPVSEGAFIRWEDIS